MAVIDAVVLLANQRRQVKHPGRAHIALQVLGADAQQDRGANQARRDGIDVAGHRDRRKAGDDDPQLLARSKRGGRQWAQGHFFGGEASGSGLVAFVQEILDKMVVGRSAGEVPAASHPQGLIDRLADRGDGLALHRRFHARPASLFQVGCMP
jgi:hypothetical protein